LNVTVPAIRVDSLFPEGGDDRPGRYKFFRLPETPEGEVDGMNFACPCGCGMVGGIGFEGRPVSGPKWSFNGDRDKPTCAPSIGFYGANKLDEGHHWHGFLTDGVFVGC
jgi:Family of unknown function (DUF6527)